MKRTNPGRQETSRSNISAVAELAVRGLEDGGLGRAGAARVAESRSYLSVVKDEDVSATPSGQFDARDLRLEDEINPAILLTFSKWILELAGKGSLGPAECAIVRKGLPVALPEAVDLKKEIREAKSHLDEIRKEAKPLLEGTKTQWSRTGNSALSLKPSQRRALVDSAVDGALAFLQAKERYRLLRARFALVLEGAVAAVRAEAKRRSHDEVHRITESIRWVLNDL